MAGKTAEWDEARQTAGTGIKNLTVLLELCTQWNWPVEKTDLLSSILKHHPEAKWAVPLLVNELASSGRTRALMTLFQQEVDQDPSDLQAKNNLAMTALLLNAVELRPFELARQVYEMEPTNISYASTYAFSLYQQKKWAEALNAFAPFDSKTLANPEVAGYYGLVLQANGHPRQAREYLDKAVHAQRLLPEERSLFGAHHEFGGLSESFAWVFSKAMDNHKRHQLFGRDICLCRPHQQFGNPQKPNKLNDYGWQD